MREAPELRSLHGQVKYIVFSLHPHGMRPFTVVEPSLTVVFQPTLTCERHPKCT